MVMFQRGLVGASCMLVLLGLVCGSGAYAVREKRTDAVPFSFDEDYQNGVPYDGQPIAVPKRAALLLDRLLVALQSAIDEDQAADIRNRLMQYENTNSILGEEEEKIGSALQRRGSRTAPNKGRYWKCYFNAVTCF